MAFNYYRATYDNLSAEEEHLVVEKDDYTTRLPIQAKKHFSVVSWFLRLALVVSIAVNVYLWIKTRMPDAVAHQMFCKHRLHQEPASPFLFADGANISPCNSRN